MSYNIDYYIQLEDQRSSKVRYFISGQLNEDGSVKAGIVYGNVGSGEYDTWFVENGELVPDDGDRDWGQVESIMNEKYGNNFIYHCFSSLPFQLVQNDFGEYHIVGNCQLVSDNKIQPIDYGSTYFTKRR